MKRILLMVALLAIAFNSNALAVQRTATFGDKNSSNVYRMTATNDGVITFAQDTGMVLPYTTATTNTTLTAAQSGTTFVSTSTSTNAAFTLPTATVGLNYNIIAGSAKQLQVRIQSTDTIAFATNTAGQGLVNSSAALGDSLELFCYVANTWSVKNHDGTWTHTGASP